MKKFFFLAVIPLFAGMAVFAQEQAPEQEQVQTPQAQTQEQEPEPEPGPKVKPIEIHLNYFVGSVGLHIPFGVEGSMQLFNLGVEHAPSGVGTTFSPFNVFGWLGARSPEGSSDTYFAMDGGVNLINVGFYWDIGALVVPDHKFFFGPVTELNWLFFGYLTAMKNGLDVERLRFFAGFQYGIRRGDKIKFTPFSVEMGGCFDYNPNPSIATKDFIYAPKDGKDWKFFVRIKFGR